MRPAEGSSLVELARREQLVRGTAAVLAERGYAATSLAAVAAAVGVSKGVVHYHFHDKDELLRVLVATVRAERGQYAAARVADSRDASEALTVYLTAHLEYLDTHRNEVLALQEVCAGLPPGDPELEATRTEALDALAALIRVGQRSRHFRPGDARLVALWVLAIIDAIPAQLRVEPTLDLPSCAFELGELVLRAISI